MYFAHKFIDPFAHRQAVMMNTKDMLKGYVLDQATILIRNQRIAVADHAFVFGNMILDTDTMIDEWVNANPDATLDQVIDYASRLIEDFVETFTDYVAELLADRVNGKAS